MFLKVYHFFKKDLHNTQAHTVNTQTEEDFLLFYYIRGTVELMGMASLD